MRALVTGAAGFIGRHFTQRLDNDGWHVVTCDTFWGRDAIDVFDEMGHVDLVVHAAANVGGRAKIDGDPLWIAHNLAIDEACFRHAVRTRSRVLYFSSSASYPTLYQVQGIARVLREQDFGAMLQNADSTYGAVKVVGEYLAEQARANGADVHVVRPFSGYGEDQSLDYPFPSFIDRAKRRADPFDVWGPGTHVRDWIHVDDIVEACLRIVDADYQRPVNLCTGIPTTFLELAAKVCAAVGYEPTVVTHPDKPTGVHYRVGDPARMYQFWEPRVSLDEGIARAVAA